MHPLYARQLAAATGRDEQVDLAALAAAVSATYARIDCRRARAIARERRMAGERAARAAELKRLVAELKAQNERFAAAIENMSQGLCFFDGEQRLIICNRRFAEMYGLKPEHVRPGTRLSEIVDRRFEAGSDPGIPRAEYVAWRRNIANQSVPHTSLVELRNGRIIAIRHQPMPDGGWVSTHEDITEQRQAETRIAHMARHDALTGLANRVLLRERLDEVLAKTHPSAPCAVLWLDLDHFKSINETEGHTTGDALLRAAAARIRRLVRERDIIARIGGDEFAIVQSRVGQPAGATALAARLVQELGLPFQIAGEQFVIGASIGIAIAPADGTDADQLLKNADIALYRAKSEGRARYRLFEPAMDALMQARRILALDLRKALAEEEFELFYQPLVRVPSRRISGFEALLRWHHPTRGLVPPGEFIPFAEEMGLVTQLDEWVLRAACREAAAWPGELSDAVNLSAAHFRSDAVIATVAAALADSGLRPDRLEIEITESMMIENSESALAILHQLRKLGARLSMDDFGTGYSSLGYLRNFRFDKIKIDQSFVRELATRPDCIAIIRAVTSLCGSLGMATTAEGVETDEQLAALMAENCTEVQGHLFSRPQPACEIPRLLASLSPQLTAAA